MRDRFENWANDEGRSTNNADFPDSYYWEFAAEFEAEFGRELTEAEWYEITS